MQTLHAQQRRVPTPYIDRGVDVRVVGVTTRDALKSRLAFARSRVNDIARSAGLRGKPGWDRRNLAAPLFHLVGQDRRELVPALREDGAVEPCLLADLAAGIGHGAPR